MKRFQIRPFHVFLLVLALLGALVWMGLRWFLMQTLTPEFVTSGVAMARQQMQIGTPDSLRQCEDSLKGALRLADTQFDPKKPLKQMVLKEYINFLNKQHREREAAPLSAELARLQAP